MKKFELLLFHVINKSQWNKISKQANLLVVCHCYRELDTVIRLISARKNRDIRKDSTQNKLSGVFLYEQESVFFHMGG